MTKSKAVSNVVGEIPLRGSWTRFWFQPTDAATLGLMRIITGLIVIYVHLAYCFDLQSFFGEHAWIDRPTVDKERKEAPVLAENMWSYKQDFLSYRIALPNRNDVGRRIAVLDFLNHLPENPDERRRKLRFLERVQGQSYSEFASIQKWLEAVTDLSEIDLQKQREYLARPLQEKNPIQIVVPEYMLDQNMSPEIRVIVWDEAMDFLSIMPKNLSQIANFTEVLRWLNELGYGGRRAALELMYRLPKDKKERSEYLDYFAYWDVLPDETYSKGKDIFSLWFHVTDPTTMAICHGVIMVIFLLFTVGLFTRVTSVLTWLAALFYIHRCYYILFGMDTMMIILLFYLMIGPCGATMSVDRLLARYRASRAILKAAGKPVPWAEAVLSGPVRLASANFVLRLVQIHFCIIYMSSGLAKLKGNLWWDTTANWYTIANPEFSPIWFDAYDSALRWVANMRPVFTVILAGLNYFTLGLEIGFPFLVWTRARAYVLMAAIVLHTGIAMTMGLSIFGLLMMTLLLCYIPAAVIRERVNWPAGSGPDLHVYFNSRDRQHVRTVGTLRMFDLADQLRFHDEAIKGDNAAHDPVRLVNGSGVPVTGGALVDCATHSLVFLKSIQLLFWVPGVQMLLRWAMRV